MEMISKRIGRAHFIYIFWLQNILTLSTCNVNPACLYPCEAAEVTEDEEAVKAGQPGVIKTPAASILYRAQCWLGLASLGSAVRVGGTALFAFIKLIIQFNTNDVLGL